MPVAFIWVCVVGACPRTLLRRILIYQWGAWAHTITYQTEPCRPLESNIFMPSTTWITCFSTAVQPHFGFFSMFSVMRSWFRVQQSSSSLSASGLQPLMSSYISSGGGAIEKACKEAGGIGHTGCHSLSWPVGAWATDRCGKEDADRLGGRQGGG